LPGGAKGRHAKTRQNHHLAGFRMATFRVFAPKTRLYDMAQISYHSFVWIQNQIYIFEYNESHINLRLPITTQ